MKQYKPNIFTLSAFLLFALSSSAQYNVPDFSSSLIASKNGAQKIYKTGSRFFLKYSSNSLVQHCRGVFTELIDGKIVIAANRKKKEKIVIAPEDIILLRAIKPGKRILYGGIGAVLVVGGAALIDNTGDTPGSAIKGAIIIPFIGVGAYFLLAIPVTLFLEKLNEKKITNGWTFKVEKK